MPLIKSRSDSAFKTNVRNLMDEYKAGTSKHVQSPQQALAISYAIKRRAKHARGGKVKGYDTGGATDPVSAVITALQSGSNQVASPGSNPGMNASAPTPAAAAQAPAGVTTPTPLPTNTGLGTSNPLAQTMSAGIQNQPQVQQATLSGQQVGGVQTVLKPAGMAFGGMPGAGIGQMPWFAKRQAMSLNHSGPIMSAVPGRTDRHNVNVGSGAYVLPADHVSSLGQGNTQAGMHILNRMFGTPGKMPMGGGAPKPPRMMGVPGDKGGARGDATGKSVPVIVAGGEYIIPVEQVAKIGDGDVRRGHAILDKWVISNRKKHVATLKKLPGPAKA